MSVSIPRLAPGQNGTAHLNPVIAAIEAALNAMAPEVIPTYTFSTVPTAAANVGELIRVSNGNHGAACLAISDGTNWNVVSVGSAISSS